MLRHIGTIGILFTLNLLVTAHPALAQQMFWAEKPAM